MVRSIRTPVLIQGRLWTYGNQSNVFEMGGDLNARKPTEYTLGQFYSHGHFNRLVPRGCLKKNNLRE